MAKNKQAAGKTLVADAREAVEHCAGLNVRRAAREITKFLDARLANEGLSLAQFGLLTHIAGARDDTIGGLAERAGLDQSTLSRNLRHLETAGLVEIAAVEADLRRRAVWLTEHGASRLEKAIKAWRLAHGKLSKVIAPQEIRALANNTRRLSLGNGNWK
jgi:DNA-binding MarR family transcriptional regulator